MDHAIAWAEGRFDCLPAEHAGGACRAGFAARIGATAQDIALIPTATAVAGHIASLRAGRVRLAVHIHNTEAPIDRVAALLAAP